MALLASALFAALTTEAGARSAWRLARAFTGGGSEEHTSELQSPDPLVCRLLLAKKKKIPTLTCRASRTVSRPRQLLVMMLHQKKLFSVIGFRCIFYPKQSR